MIHTGLYYALPTSTQIIQWKARHRKIETMLRYDHVSDDIVREYFHEQQKESFLNKETNKKSELNHGYV